MATPILSTKLFIPAPGPRVVDRPRLIERLDEGHLAGVTLISAPAGFGKTTLLGEWIAAGQRREQTLRAAWLSLDDGDNDPARFLTYLIAALQRVAGEVGQGSLAVLQSPQPPPTEAILTAVVNEVSGLAEPLVLVLDDYHVIETQAVDQALHFLIEHLPPRLRLVISTREDPRLPLARLRARGQLTELRAADLRFTAGEAAEFLNRVMGLDLAGADVAALEHRTEGWIAGLQLAALALQGQRATHDHPDPAGFIRSFTGSHHYVLDYLLEEVLHQQSDAVQQFLLRTSVLDRLCGPLCEAVVLSPAGSGQAMLETLERANLFIVPLDHERRWYRYHHLFADLLRQRLAQRQGVATADETQWRPAAMHQRASQWYEDNGLEVEAFRHAVAAGDVARAAHLVEDRGIPLHYRDAVAPVLNWLASLPKPVLAARPSLWATHASLLLVIGQTAGVEEKLQAAEAALPMGEPDDKTRFLIGQIAAARSVLALTRYQVDAMLAQARRALEYLGPSQVVGRSTALWTLGYALYLLGDYAAAGQAFREGIALSQAAGRIFTLILATIGLGNVLEAENQLPSAAETYRRVLHMGGEHPLQIVHEAHLGLARVLYEWNDLAAAEQHARLSLDLARQYESNIDRFVLCEVFLARLRLAQGDAASAASGLAQAEETVRRLNFVHRRAEVAEAQVLALLRQGNVTAAAALAHGHALPLSQARVLLAQGQAAAALEVLAPRRQHAEAKGWASERLKVLALQALAHQALGDQPRAVEALETALALAEPAGCIRSFVDEGAPMAQLLAAAARRGVNPAYTGQLLAAVDGEKQARAGAAPGPGPAPAQPSIEPLTPRELEVLRLIARGLSNLEISEQLFLALDTVKGHNRRIFDKLQVQRRTEAVARARELGVL